MLFKTCTFKLSALLGRYQQKYYY